MGFFNGFRRSRGCGFVGAVCVALGATVAPAADLYWIGGTQTNSVMTAANWALADGSVSTAMPTAADTLVFTNSVIRVNWDTSLVFDQIVLRGTSPSVYLANTTGQTLYMPVRGLRNESVSGRLTFYRMYKNGTSGEQIVDVVEPEATVCEVSHGYLDGTVVKRGLGTFRPYNTSYGNVLFVSPAYAVEAGTLLFPHSRCSENSPDLFCKFYNTTLKFRGDDPSARIVFSKSTYNSYVLKTLLEENVTNHLHALADNSVGSTLTFTGAVGNVTFSGRVCDKLSLGWKPDAEATLTLDGAVHPTTGAFRLGAGTLALTNHTQALAAPLTVAAGAKVRIAAAGDWAWFKSVTVGDGATVSSGRFTAATADWLEGAGTLYVGTGESADTTTATWTGNGSDALLSNPANWGAADNAELPDLTNGTLVATFPAGAAPVVPADGRYYVFKGLVGQGALTLSARAGARKLEIGSQGVTVAGAFTNAAPVELAGNQTWTTSGTVRFAAGAPIASRAQSALTLAAGVNNVYLEEGNPDLAALTTYGILHVLAEDALGGSNTAVTVYGNGDMALSKEARLAAPLVLYGHAQHARVKITAINNAEGNNVFDLKTCATNAFFGRVEFDVPNHVYSFRSFAKGAALRFAGGYLHGGVNRDCMTVFKKDNFNVTFETSVSETKLSLDASGEATLACAQNVFRRGVHLKNASAVLRLPVAHAFARQDGSPDGKSMTKLSSLAFWKNGRVDLCGTEQEVQVLYGTTGRIASDEPAVFTLDGDKLWEVKTTYYDSAPTLPTNGLAQCTNAVVFSGNVSLVKTGALTNVFCGVSSATGTVRVAAGRLVFAPTAEWSGATSVSVAGGQLALERSGVFPKTADIRLETGGTLDLAAGVVQKCRYLFIDGREQDVGTWGGADSAAAHKTSLLAGAGLLKVRGDGLGMVILFR